MKSKEKEVMMTAVMMAMMVTKHDSYERNASLQNAPELILARCKDVLWHRAQWKGVLLYNAQCSVYGYVIVHSAKYFVQSVHLIAVQSIHFALRVHTVQCMLCIVHTIHCEF